MLFYSPLFLFFFLPAAFLIYFASPRRLQNTILLLTSFFFYFFAEPKFALIALASAVADYWICHFIYKNRSLSKLAVLSEVGEDTEHKTGACLEKCEDLSTVSTNKFTRAVEVQKKSNKGNRFAYYWLTLGVSLNIGVLLYFKYMDFFVQSVNSLLTLFHINALSLLKIALPIGVSFIVFEKITYLVDVYRGVGKPSKTLRSYLLYVFLFPKLLAGPIVKYHDIVAQLSSKRKQAFYDFFEGFKRFLLGLIKKLLLADTVGEIANKIFGLPFEQIGFGNSWLGIVCFTLQIYLDFSAYSDMAIGLARMFGFRLLENFNMPYIATSFTDFWRRWHISLSTWIKEYLYYPLGGNRKGEVRTYINLWICFLLSGLWHGASWTFVLWGAYNGFFLVIDKLGWLRISQTWPRFINISLTLFFVMLGWVLFRCNSLEHVIIYLSALFNPWKEGAIIYVTANVWLAIGIGVLISLIPLTNSYNAFVHFWRSRPLLFYIEHLVLTFFSFLAISRAVVATFNPFLYFRF